MNHARPCPCGSGRSDHSCDHYTDEVRGLRAELKYVESVAPVGPGRAADRLVAALSQARSTERSEIVEYLRGLAVRDASQVLMDIADAVERGEASA